MPNTTQYNSPVASTTIEQDGIYLLKLKDTFIAFNDIELENQLNFINKHSKGEPYRVLIDTSESINIPTDEAGLYYRANNRPEDRFAFVSTNFPFQIFIGQLIIQREVKNMKLFKTSEEAKEWLLENTSQ